MAESTNISTTARPIYENIRMQYTFIVMDFEFTRWHDQKIVLVSGAITNCHSRSNVVKLQGPPLELSPKSGYSLLSIHLLKTFRQFNVRALKNKPKTLGYLLNELYNSISISRSKSNLHPKFIKRYFSKSGKQCIVVLWNGSNDFDILERLKLKIPIILNLSTYNNFGDDQFFLKLTNWRTKELLFDHKITNFSKIGRQLSLEEAHTSLCNATHRQFTNLHDPVVDVIYTRCIFKYIIRMVGYNNLVLRAINSSNSSGISNCRL